MTGYTIGTMFIRAYEQGERTYLAMLCRGYGKDSHLYVTKKAIKGYEWAFLAVSFALIISTPVLVWYGIVHFF
jgi:cobalt/nickel transport system permease protein